MFEVTSVYVLIHNIESFIKILDPRFNLSHFLKYFFKSWISIKIISPQDLIIKNNESSINFSTFLFILTKYSNILYRH